MTPLSALRRGLGRGAYHATPDMVWSCVERDFRWDPSVDEREVYLARLVRDLGLPVGRVLDLLDGPEFDNVLGILEALGRAGDPDAIDGLTRYVHTGPQWIEVLETIAHDWPRPLWDDLRDVAYARLTPSDDVYSHLRPWSDWTGSELIKTPLPHPRPLKDRSTDALLTEVRATSSVPALRELNFRGAHPELLSFVDELSFGVVQGPIQRALRNLGTQALPTARAWAASPGHPLTWAAYLILADCGDESDLPALLAAWDWLDRRGNDECGYMSLSTGIARIGGPAAAEAVPRIRRKLLGPHSYERVFHLRALLALDPERSRPLLAEGLWDCESRVRQLAAELAPLDEGTTRRLRYLRDDPMEHPEVRAAAELRCRDRTDGRPDPA